MTFEQAAGEVLRRTGKALTPRQIADLAVKHSLLTVVGKRPAETMSARLRVATRPGNTSDIVRMTSGNYGLRDWGGKPPGTGEGFPEPEKPAKAKKPAKARASEDDGAQATDSRRKKKRRSKRGKKGRDNGAAAAAEDSGDKGNAARDANGESRRGRRRRRNKGEASAPAHVEEAEGEIPLGADAIGGIVDGAYGVLRSSGGRNPLHFHRIAELGRKKNLKATGYAIHAAILADNQRRESLGLRPRFVAGGEGEWGLAEWDLPNALVKAEQALADAAAAMRVYAVRELTSRIKAMDSDTFQQLAALLLQRLGYGNITLVGRSSQGNVALTATFEPGHSAQRMAFVLRTAGGALRKRHVEDTLKNLGEFGATGGSILAPAGVTAEARQAAGEPGDAPLSIYDAEAVAELCVKVGVGVVQQHVTALRPDVEFLTSLALR